LRGPACIIFIDFLATGCRRKTSRIRFRRHFLVLSFHAPIAFRLPAQHEDIPRPDPSPWLGEGDREAFRRGFFRPAERGTDMDIRDERYLDYIAMLLISILLLGLTLFEVAMVVLSRSGQG